MNERRDIADAALDPAGADTIVAAGAAALRADAVEVRAATEVPASSEPLAAVEPAPRAASAGVRLREARELRGIGVQQVTDALHIEPHVVAAMESDDFGVFDAPVYARGFLRKYAAFLELPADEIVASYDAAYSGPVAPSLVPTTAAAAPPRDWSAYRLPAAAVLAVAVIAGAWWWWSARTAFEAPGAAGQSASTAQEAAGAAQESVGAVQEAPGSGTDAAALPSSGTVAAAPVSGVAAASTSSSTMTAASQPAVASPARIAGRGALVFRFGADCWVEVYGPAGQRLLFDLAQAGDTRGVPGPGPWQVFVGYADGVSLNIDGRAVPIPAARRRGATARFTIASNGAVQ